MSEGVLKLRTRLQGEKYRGDRNRALSLEFNSKLDVPNSIFKLLMLFWSDTDLLIGYHPPSTHNEQPIKYRNNRFHR